MQALDDLEMVCDIDGSCLTLIAEFQRDSAGGIVRQRQRYGGDALDVLLPSK